MSSLRSHFSHLRGSRNVIPQFLRYVASGVTVNLLDICGYLLLFWLGVWYVAASITSGVVSFFAAFVLQKFVVFQKKDQLTGHFLRYTILSIGNILAVSFILYVLVDGLGVREEWAKFIANGSQVFWNYVLMRKIVYT